MSSSDNQEPRRIYNLIPDKVDSRDIVFQAEKLRVDVPNYFRGI